MLKADSIRWNEIYGSWRSFYPLEAHIELTYKCNFKCVYCFCSMDNAKITPELNYSDWKRVLDKLYMAGILRVTFTGGEPLAHNDFKDIYLYAKKKGFIISVFTNGALLTRELMGFFVKEPPFLIEITLHSLDAKIYSSITGSSVSRLKLLLETMRQLKLHNLNLVIKTVGLKENKTEISKIKIFAESLLGNNRFRFDYYVFPKLNGDNAPCRHRLSVKDICSILERDKDILLTNYQQHANSKSLPVNNGRLYICNSWHTSFFINPYGMFRFCLLSEKYSWDTLKHDFKPMFYKSCEYVSHLVRTSHAKCGSCNSRRFCITCPARAFLESGNEEEPVDFFCRLAHAEKNRFKDGIKARYKT